MDELESSWSQSSAPNEVVKIKWRMGYLLESKKKRQSNMQLKSHQGNKDAYKKKLMLQSNRRLRYNMGLEL